MLRHCLAFLALLALSGCATAPPRTYSAQVLVPDWLAEEVDWAGTVIALDRKDRSSDPSSFRVRFKVSKTRVELKLMSTVGLPIGTIVFDGEEILVDDQLKADIAVAPQVLFLDFFNVLLRPSDEDLKARFNQDVQMVEDRDAQGRIVRRSFSSELYGQNWLVADWERGWDGMGAPGLVQWTNEQVGYAATLSLNSRVAKKTPIIRGSDR